MDTESINTLSDYLNKEIRCTCGRTHSTSLKHIDISKDALHKIPNIINEHKYSRLYIISDCNTYSACGADVMHILREHDFTIQGHTFDDAFLIPDEKAVDVLLHTIPDDTQLIIGIGTGTICDLGKYVSHKLNLPFFIIATAPSMDGFASNVSCLLINGMKTTLETHIPEAVIADINVLKSAPKKMIAAGAGDILGKYICLLDWKIANIITGEYYCEYVESIVRNSIQAVTSDIEGLNRLKDDAVMHVMEGLVLSGIAMSFVGNSRPASGSEHHLSHYWELNFILRNKPPVLHGIKVGLGTLETLALYYKLLDTMDEDGFPDFDKSIQALKTFSYDEWSTDIHRVYGPLAEDVIQLEKTYHKNLPSNVKGRLSIIKKRWPDIYVAIKAYLPKVDQLMAILKSLGAPTKPCMEQIEPWLVHDSILYAKELRNRYGLLQLLFDLGCLNESAESTLAQVRE